MNDTATVEPRPRRSPALKIAIGAVVTAGILATGGVAHAGYRWGKMAPAPTTTVKPAPTTTVRPAPTTTVAHATATTEPLATIDGYRWG